MSVFRIEASMRRLIGANAFAFLLGTIVVVFLSFFRNLFSPLAVVSVIVALAFCLGGEIVSWFFRGIRDIALAPEAISLEFGNKRSVRRILKKEVTNVRIRRFIGESTVVIGLRAAAGSRSAFARLGRGPRVTIRSNAFEKPEFEGFLREISRWRFISLDSHFPG